VGTYLQRAHRRHHGRAFPPPWTLEEMNDACFIVRDANGQALAYVYFEEEPRSRTAKLPHPRRGAADDGELRQVPELLRRRTRGRSSLGPFD
jgi:hypothetical protein